MTNEELQQKKWVQWAKELQSIAQCGLAYCKDPFCEERYQRIREISAEILQQHSDLEMEEIRNLFCGERGYQTPKVTTRAILFQEGKVLLVRERGGLWNLPGGWCDERETIRQSVEKELWEEAGIRGKVTRLVAVQDRNTRNSPPSILNMTNHLFLLEPVGEIGPFQPNLETEERGFFSLDQLPPLDTRRTTREQIMLCWEASQADVWEPIVD